MIQKCNYLLFVSVFFALIVSIPSTTHAQCDSWEAHPDGKESAMEQHVIYRRLFEQKKYAEAFPIWEKLFASVTSPKESKTVHFKDGINMYKAFAKEEKDKDKKEEKKCPLKEMRKKKMDQVQKNNSDKKPEPKKSEVAKAVPEKKVEPKKVSTDKKIDSNKNTSAKAP